ncbi:AAA family ATPase [Nocardioides aurantiacus]|uniref:AAA family ATPase n=1 Tax=Nocardioides aurantiacus TaxID=86796 RepID=UPI00403FB86B
MTDRIELVRLLVPAYKNLRDVVIPWTSGVTLIGANGAGKTNLLETMALLFGTDETLDRSSDRLDLVSAPGLSAVVRHDGANMPLPMDDLRVAVREASKPSSLPAGAARDMEWHLATNPAEFDAAAVAWSNAVVRYTLRRVIRTPQGWRREFTRELLNSDAPDAVSLLTLPDSSAVPARFQWLPASRTGEQIEEDLDSAWEYASNPTMLLAENLGDVLPMREPEGGGEALWWLQEMAADVATAELRLTSPQVEVTPDPSDFAGGVLCHLTRDGETTTLGSSSDHATIVRFSAGQRRWLDEALGRAADGLRSFADLAQLYGVMLHRLDDESFFAAVMENLEADQRVATEEYWDYESFRDILASLETELRAAADEMFQTTEAHPVMRMFLRSWLPAIAAHRETIVVRAFDEPEAHLHPAAQRKVADALESLRLGGQNIVVSTHSPVFVEQPEWSTLRVANGRVTLVDPTKSPARSQLARDLGVTSGELLNGISWILVVEGEHDRLVLDWAFGDELRRLRVAVVRMFGTENIKATLELDFVQAYLDVPMTVMLDNTSVDRVTDKRLGDKALTDEEFKARQLLKEAKARHKQLDLIGLNRVDIAAYLGERAIRATVPRFPGWSDVLRRFAATGSRDRFKEWLMGQAGVDLQAASAIEATLRRMRELGEPLADDLPLKMNEFLAKVQAVVE